MEHKPQVAACSPTTGATSNSSGVIVQSSLVQGSPAADGPGPADIAASSLITGSTAGSILASTVGQSGPISESSTSSTATATTATTTTGLTSKYPAVGAIGRGSPCTATPVKGSSVSGTSNATTGSTSCIASPILSPPGKIFGRNNNGIMVVTSTPSNEAELQLYRVLQRASLLNYYDTLLEMGGDDVQQLCDAGEEEFLEIMALVGMASKPLHVRRLQKALHEWMTNPSAFQSPLTNVDIPSRIPYSPEPGSISRSVTSASSGPVYGTPSVTMLGGYPVLGPNPSSSTNLPTSSSSNSASLASAISSQIGSTTSGSVQLTPALTEDQVAKIVQAAERLSRTLPRLEPRQQSIKKRSARDLEAVIAMNENDPRRMDEIRKYSAIYGRFDCKRRPEKPLTLHEVCVNEAAAQICKYIPALLTRRDELFPLARQVVRDCGFGHSASIRLTGLSQTQPNRGDDLDTVQQLKRARLSSDTSSDLGKENSDDNRDISSGSIYQQISDKPFDLTDSSKFSYTRSEFDDTDSRFSFSNSSSSPVQAGNGADRDLSDPDFGDIRTHTPRVLDPTGGSLGVQVISSSGGHIIAVANPALALSPALSEAIAIKREAISPDI
ncbi:NGFI-A-binding protein homolog [Anopheles darlingi]|uniref:NGFI-A-binding protein homolog n=1 Tax=Anopheles darlingi TaxID=43151 RepID=UPI0020FFF8A0|nr:NGFI-A-binding protein homolog [Anopheles darlingi]